MKKRFSLALLLSFALSILVSAEAIYPDANALYQAWMSAQQDWTCSPYPDYVCGVWSTYGDMSHLTIAVTKDEAGEAGKSEILDWIEDDSTVAFTYQSHSYAELLSHRLEIETHLGEDNGMWGIGMDEMKNQITIDVDLSNPNAQAFCAEILARYGDMVSISDGNAVVLDNTATSDQVKGSSMQLHCEILILICCLSFIGFYCLFLRHRQFTVQTVFGSTTAFSVPLTRAQTIAMVRNSTETPNPKVLSNLLNKLS